VFLQREGLVCRVSDLTPCTQALLRASASDPVEEVRAAAHASLEVLPLDAAAVLPQLDALPGRATAEKHATRKQLRAKGPTAEHDDVETNSEHPSARQLWFRGMSSCQCRKHKHTSIYKGVTVMIQLYTLASYQPMLGL
jgi:hypothetical protein